MGRWRPEESVARIPPVFVQLPLLLVLLSLVIIVNYTPTFLTHSLLIKI